MHYTEHWSECSRKDIANTDTPVHFTGLSLIHIPLVLSTYCLEVRYRPHKIMTASQHVLNN
jgi:hypothetical protein